MPFCGNGESEDGVSCAADSPRTHCAIMFEGKDISPTRATKKSKIAIFSITIILRINTFENAMHSQLRYLRASEKVNGA